MPAISVKVTCLVDNAVLGGSGFWGEHGLSFLIEPPGERILFDSGGSGTVLLHNLKVLRVDPASITAVILSHGHNDHTGGLSNLLERTARVPLYGHSDLFRERFVRRGTRTRRIGPAMSELEARKRADLRLEARAQTVVPGVHTTGEVVVRSEPEGRSRHHVVRQENGWAEDPYRDDISLVMETKHGLVLLCGCCHAGLLNTMNHVRAQFEAGIAAVVGGTHLGSMNARQMKEMVVKLRGWGPPRLYPNHCTGITAFVTLSSAFGSLVAPCPAGVRLVF